MNRFQHRNSGQFDVLPRNLTLFLAFTMELRGAQERKKQENRRREHPYARDHKRYDGD